MSLEKHTYLLLGVKLPIDSIPGGRYADRWLPYIEGHKGVEISMLYGEGNDNIYIGKVLAKTSPWDGDPEVSVSLGLSDDMTMVSTFLFNELACCESPRLMFFSLYS